MITTFTTSMLLPNTANQLSCLAAWQLHWDANYSLQHNLPKTPSKSVSRALVDIPTDLGNIENIMNKLATETVQRVKQIHKGMDLTVRRKATRGGTVMVGGDTRRDGLYCTVGGKTLRGGLYGEREQMEGWNVQRVRGETGCTIEGELQWGGLYVGSPCVCVLVLVE